MTFEEILAQVLQLLQREGRLSYRALKVRFHIDDDYLEALKDEIIEAKQQAVDENGKVLVWTGGSGTAPVPVAASDLADQPPGTERLSAESLAPLQADPALQAVSPPGTPGTSEAERRQLTVMFCDLIDSTGLAGRLDPEEFREMVRSYQATCAEVIQHFDGYIAQYLGDGLLVYYGYPQAHEDDAQRAIRTGLGIMRAIGTLNARLEREYAMQLSVRIGIHTGRVVVGEMGGGDRRERLALGETPNLAAKIQGLAAPNTVVISAVTYRLTQGYFVCQELGQHTFRVEAVPVHLYRVLAEGQAQNRWDVAVTAGLTPFVGRREEVGLLQQRWEQSQEGLGQVVLLRGEGGIGKSRLVEALRAQAGNEDYTWRTFRCSPYHTHSAFYAVIEALPHFLQWRRDDAPAEKLAKLERRLQMARRSLPALEEVVPLFAALLAVPLPAERYPPLNLSPQLQKQRTQEALVAFLLEEAEWQPVLAVWEDLHWADPSTLELLSLLIDQTPTARMLTLLTFRPEFEPPWGIRAHLTQITLSRLGRQYVSPMVVHLAQGKALPAEVLEQVLDKTDGVPLFVEELVKMVLESGLVREEADCYVLTGPLPPLAIPATLQDSLMARLDRLGSAREVAQLGAMLGREFDYELIEAVSLMEQPTLQHELAQLVAAELVYQRGLPPRAHYSFKHTLIQETAYQSLLKSTRQHYHQRIALALAARFPETVETQPELLAHHYTEAGLATEAISYWLRAGQRAVERSANVEAIRHLTKGLEVLTGLSDTPERVQHELALHLALGPPLFMIKGQESLEVAEVYNRAHALCQQLGDSRQSFSVLMGLCTFYNAQGRLQTSRDLAEQSLALAQDVGDSVLLHEAHIMLGSILFTRGEFVSARTHLEQGLALRSSQQPRSVLLIRGADSEVVGAIWLAYVLWILGYPDQALAKSREALQLAQELSHAYTRALAFFFAAMLHQWRREVQCVQERLYVALSLSKEQGFPRWLTCSLMLQGWVLAQQGMVEDGIAQLQQGLTTWRDMGNELALPYYLAMLTEAYGKAGRTDEGLRVLAEAQAIAHKNAEHRFDAELLRLKGELLLQQGRERDSGHITPLDTALMAEVEREGMTQALPLQTAAEICFHQGLNVARQQHAKSLELRVATSLSRLWQAQGKRAEAHQLLAESYGWFTDGFETADLQEAKALLDTLACAEGKASCEK
jgi:class 3 adenylate cyclase/predicted ATPase